MQLCVISSFLDNCILQILCMNVSGENIFSVKVQKDWIQVLRRMHRTSMKVETVKRSYCVVDLHCFVCMYARVVSDVLRWPCWCRPQVCSSAWKSWERTPLPVSLCQALTITTPSLASGSWEGRNWPSRSVLDHISSLYCHMVPVILQHFNALRGSWSSFKTRAGKHSCLSSLSTFVPMQLSFSY